MLSRWNTPPQWVSMRNHALRDCATLDPDPETYCDYTTPIDPDPKTYCGRATLGPSSTIRIGRPGGKNDRAEKRSMHKMRQQTDVVYRVGDHLFTFFKPTHTHTYKKNDNGIVSLFFLRFRQTWTKRYLITSPTRVKRVSRIHHRTILKVSHFQHSYKFQEFSNFRYTKPEFPIYSFTTFDENSCLVSSVLKPTKGSISDGSSCQNRMKMFSRKINAIEAAQVHWFSVQSCTCRSGRFSVFISTIFYSF